VKTLKKVYRLNGCSTESVLMCSFYRSVLSAHLHVIGMILQTPGSMVDFESACDAREEVRQTVSTNRALAQEP
jgi:hypothetical protein